MSSTPAQPSDVPPYQIQNLISSLGLGEGNIGPKICCAQASGTEIYVGCSNGDLIRFALQADDPNKLESYSILSQQTLPNGKPVDEIVLIPSISRALILSDRQVHFYTLPSLDVVPPHVIKPIRNVVTFAVDHQHLQRPPPSLHNNTEPEPVEFSVIKRNTIAMYSLRDRLFFQKEIPFPEGASLARRIGRSLCIADKSNYNIVDLENASLLQILPLNQAQGELAAIRPHIAVVSSEEFLILSWTGATTLGVFISTDGDPVRGTLEWSSHPKSVCIDHPYITTLLPDGVVEIHSVETQAIIQVVGVNPDRPVSRRNLASSFSGYLVPSSQKSDRMKKTAVNLARVEQQ